MMVALDALRFKTVEEAAEEKEAGAAAEKNKDKK
jgi:hypothetical protein